MQGTIFRTTRDGGTINSPPHGDVQFLWADVARGLKLRQNQQVEFDIADDGQGGEKAINVRTIRQQSPIAATIRFGEHQDQPTYRGVPCTIALQRGNQPVVDVVVKLTANGHRQTYPSAEPKTDSFGNVFFRLILTVGETQADVAVEAGNNVYTSTWKISKPKPQLTAKESMGEGWKSLSVIYADGEMLVPAVLELRLSNACEVAFRESAQAAWTTFSGNTEVPTTGRTILQLRIDNAPTGVGGVDVYVGIKGSIVETGPYYLSAIV